MRGTATAESDPLFATLKETGGFVWAHLLSTVAISVCWFVASLPIVTVGPATVGAYRAVLSLRADGNVDRDAVASTVRSQFVHATLLGLLPVTLVAMTATYAGTYLSSGSLIAGLLALGGVYVTAYLSLLLVPTFVGLASGASVTRAVRDGYLWTARYGVEAAALGIVTLLLFAVTSLMTIAVVLLFAGTAFAFHVAFVTDTDESDRIGRVDA